MECYSSDDCLLYSTSEVVRAVRVSARIGVCVVGATTVVPVHPAAVLCLRPPSILYLCCCSPRGPQQGVLDLRRLSDLLVALPTIKMAVEFSVCIVEVA